MKPAICAVLAACSIVAVAEEASPPTTTVPSQKAAVPAPRTPGLPEGWTLNRDGTLLRPDGKSVPIRRIESGPLPSTTCYFMRTVRPITVEEIREAERSLDSPGGTAPKSFRVVPLQAQARIAGTVDMPICAQAGKTIHTVR